MCEDAYAKNKKSFDALLENDELGLSGDITMSEIRIHEGRETEFPLLFKTAFNYW